MDGERRLGRFIIHMLVSSHICLLRPLVHLGPLARRISPRLRVVSHCPEHTARSGGWRFSDTAFAFAKCSKVRFFFFFPFSSVSHINPRRAPFRWTLSAAGSHLTHVHGNRKDLRSSPYDGETFPLHLAV